MDSDHWNLDNGFCMLCLIMEDSSQDTRQQPGLPCTVDFRFLQSVQAPLGIKCTNAATRNPIRSISRRRGLMRLPPLTAHLERGLDAAGQGHPFLGRGRELRGLAAQLPPRDRRRRLLHHDARTGPARVPHPNRRTHRGPTVAADDDVWRRGREQVAAAPMAGEAGR